MAKKKKKVVISKKKSKKSGSAPKAAPKSSSSLFTIPNNLADQARDIWMAGRGALAAVEEEGAKRFNTLVQRGEEWERTGQKQLQAAASSAKKQADDATDAAKETVKEMTAATARIIDDLEERIESAVEPVLERMGVPNKQDLAALTSQIEMLTEKLERIAKDDRTKVSTKAKKAAEAVSDAVKGSAESVKKAANKKAAKKSAAKKATANKAAPKKTAKEVVASVYAVEKHADGWAVMKEGNERATSVHGTKAAAVKEAREIARTHAPSMLVILKADGSEQERNTYEVE